MNELLLSVQSARSPARLRYVGLVLTFASACTLHDYEYLGAARGLTAQDGGQAGQAQLTARGARSGVAGGTSTTTAATEAGGTRGSDLTKATSTEGGAGKAGGTPSGSSSSGVIAGAGGRWFGSGGRTGNGGTQTLVGSGAGASGGSSAIGSTTAATSGGASGANGSGGYSSGGVSSGDGGVSTTAGGVSAASSTSGGTASCPGCARLDVPFTAPGQRARYYLKFLPWATVNARSGSSITYAGTMKIRARVRQLGNTQYQMLIQQDSGDYVLCFSPVTTLPVSITSSWVTLEWSLGSCASDASIGRLGLDLITSSAEAAPGTTSMLLDSIWIEVNGTTVVGPFDFTAASSVDASAVANDWAQATGVLYLRPSTVAPASTPPSGSTIAWEGSG